NWQDEVDSAAEYRAMSASEPDPRLAKVYANLAAMEEGHIGFWEDRLRRVGAKVPPLRASWRSRVLAAIARRLGPDLVLATIAAKETVDQNSYLKQPETAGTAMPGHERWHAKVLQQLVSSQPRGLQGASSAASRAGIDRSAATRCAPRSSAPALTTGPSAATTAPRPASGRPPGRLGLPPNEVRRGGGGGGDAARGGRGAGRGAGGVKRGGRARRAGVQ